MNSALTSELQKELRRLVQQEQALRHEQEIIAPRIEALKVLLGDRVPESAKSAPEPEPEAPTAPRPSELPPPADSPAAKSDIGEQGPKDPYYVGRAPTPDEKPKGMYGAIRQALGGFPDGASSSQVTDAIQVHYPDVNRTVLKKRVSVNLCNLLKRGDGVKKLGLGRYALDNGAAA